MPIRPVSLTPAIAPQGLGGVQEQTIGQELLGSLSPGGQQAIQQLDIEQQQREEAAAEQQRLEEENGILGTMALQTARGALSALTAPGALVAAGAEGVGSLLGSASLERFGRELGEAATGESAIEALAFGGGAAAGGDEGGLTAYSDAQQKLDDQQKAWPTLSAVSNMAGMAALALATGGAAAAAQGGVRAGTTMALGAAEGAAGGIQGAYEQAAPLTDVLASALVGGILGAGAAGAGELIGAGTRALARRVAPGTEYAIQALASGAEPRLVSAEAKQALRTLTEDMTTKVYADRSSEVRKIIGRRGIEAGEERIRQVSGDVMDFEFRAGPRAGQKIIEAPNSMLGIRSNDEIPRVLEEAAEEAGARVGTRVAGEAAEAVRGAAAPPGGLSAVKLLKQVKSELIDPLQRDVGGMTGMEARRALRDVANRLGHLTDEINITETVVRNGVEVEVPVQVGSTKWWNAVADLDDDAAQIRFSELRAEQQRLAKVVYPKPISGVAPPVPRSMQQLQRFERQVAGYLEEEGAAALERAGMGATRYRDTMRVASSLRVAADAAKHKGIADIGNRAISPSDYLTGIGVSASGGLLGMAAALPGALAHRYIRQNGRALAAVQLQRISRALEGDVSRSVGVFNRALGYGRKAIAKTQTAGRRFAFEAEPVIASASEQWNTRKKKLETALSNPNALMAATQQVPGMPDQIVAQASIAAQQRLARLSQDIPKPRQDIRGPAYESLSSNDVRLANAMYEATVDPMSIFEDYQRGTVDYDKIQYAWKQYPGLQQACQAGVIDMLTVQMGDPDRAAIPDTTLTQIDYFFGFGGTLQPSVSAALGRNMTLAAGPEQQEQQQQGRPLGKMPTADLTPIGRMMQGRG